MVCFHPHTTHVHVRLTGDSKLAADVGVNSCLSVHVRCVIDW